MKLKEIRQKKKYSQAEAASLLNIPLRTYKRYELDSSYQKSYKYEFICNEISNLPINNVKNKSQCYHIAIVGIGYVGTSLGAILSQTHKITFVDIDENKVNSINNKRSPIKEPEIDKYLSKGNIYASLNCNGVFKKQDIVIIATNTDYDEERKCFNTSSIEETIKHIVQENNKAFIIIKSTIPIGYCQRILNEFPNINLLYSPEFLKEGSSIKDLLMPSRIIVGTSKINKNIKDVARIFADITINNEKPIFTGYKEAEAIKLFSNAYLALRVAYFNELDSFASENGVNVFQVIKGMALDSRIGDYYNNPSFGYGGYCLPKDSKELTNLFKNTKNNNLINAIVNSNKSRKEYIASSIIKTAIAKTHKKMGDLIIGVYRLAMKTGSDNYRNSSTLDVMNILKEKGVRVVVFDPFYPHSIANFEEFVNQSDLIIANRIDAKIMTAIDKVYSRDIYSRD